ncbi:unnamed protein product [Jaminaea pallidilutea]
MHIDLTLTTVGAFFFMATMVAACPNESNCIHLYPGVTLHCADGSDSCIKKTRELGHHLEIQVGDTDSGTLSGCTAGSGSGGTWAFSGLGPSNTLSAETHGELRWKGNEAVWHQGTGVVTVDQELHVACVKALPH